ncbi:Serine/threonine-protein kinase 17A, partial [Perkinsus chesapeaki]
MGLLCSKDLFKSFADSEDFPIENRPPEGEAADIRDYYVLGEKIGSGAYGQVRKCHCVETGDLYAVKILAVERPDRDYNQVRATVANEVYVLSKLNHPNVCKPREFFEDEYFYYQVMQMYGPPVFTGLNAKFAPTMRYRDGSEPLLAVRLPEYRIAELVRSALKACAHIHSHRIVHRDIKGDNFLFASDDVARGELVMVDFGLAIELTSEEPIRRACGTVRWVAPEMLQGGYNSGSVDIWAVGVLMYILVYGCYPYDGKVVHEVLEKILCYEPAWQPVHSQWEPSIETRKFMRRLMMKDPRKRLTAKQALRDNWFMVIGKTKPPEVIVADRVAKAAQKEAARLKKAERSTTDAISQSHLEREPSPASEAEFSMVPGSSIAATRGDAESIRDDDMSVGGSLHESESQQEGHTEDVIEDEAGEDGVRAPVEDTKKPLDAKDPPLASPRGFRTASPQATSSDAPLDPTRFISLLPSNHQREDREVEKEASAAAMTPRVKKILKDIRVELRNDLDVDDGLDVYDGDEEGASKEEVPLPSSVDSPKGGPPAPSSESSTKRRRLKKEQLRQDSKNFETKADNLLEKLRADHEHGVRRGNRIAGFSVERTALAPGPNKNPLGDNRFISSPPNANITNSTSEMSNERANVLAFRSVLPRGALNFQTIESGPVKRVSLEGIEEKDGSHDSRRSSKASFTKNQTWHAPLEEKQNRTKARRRKSILEGEAASAEEPESEQASSQR